MNRRHLCIIAHGSRRQASNDEVRRLGERVARLRAPGVDHVEVAFLELAEPSIPEGLSRCADQGASEIIVFPYFLAAGTHVAQDIPEAIAEFRRARPDIAVQLTPHLGASDALPLAILGVATQNVPHI
jgi:sirohydrochlorin ferrochelatase